MSETEIELRALMADLAVGGTESFARIYTRLEPIVRSFVARYRLNNLDKDEVAQEVFFRLWYCRARFRGESSPKSFILGIAKNVLREQRTREMRERRYSRDVSKHVLVANATDRVDVADHRLALAQMRRELLPHYCTALNLVYERGIPPKTVALILGCTEKAFRRRLEEARKSAAVVLRRSFPSLSDNLDL